MGELLSIRRRMMTKFEIWDYEWNYADGLLSDNGWSKEIAGIAQELIEETGLVLSSNINSYVRLYNSDFIVPVGVLEVVYSTLRYSPEQGVQNLRICLSNGTNGVQIMENTGYFRLMDSTVSPNKGTPILPFDTSREYTIRLELYLNAYSVFINNSLVYEGDPDSMVYSNRTMLMQHNGGSSLIKSVKLKLNRIV